MIPLIGILIIGGYGFMPQGPFWQRTLSGVLIWLAAILTHELISTKGVTW